MKYTDISTALFSLYNWSRQSESKAQDYQMVFDIKSTKPKEELIFIIGLAKKVINKIESLCNDDELAVLKFYYGFEDRFGNDKILDIVAKIAYPSNLRIGRFIAFDWRGDRLTQQDSSYSMEIMSCLSIGRRKSFYVLKDGKANLAKHQIYFTNSTDYKLASEIEKILTIEDLMF